MNMFAMYTCAIRIFIWLTDCQMFRIMHIFLEYAPTHTHRRHHHFALVLTARAQLFAQNFNLMVFIVLILTSSMWKKIGKHSIAIALHPNEQNQFDDMDKHLDFIWISFRIRSFQQLLFVRLVPPTGKQRQSGLFILQTLHTVCWFVNKYLVLLIGRCSSMCAGFFGLWFMQHWNCWCMHRTICAHMHPI